MMLPPQAVYADIGHRMEEIDLAAGEQTILTLPGLGSAGYQWRAAVQDPNVARVDKLESLSGVPPGAGGSSDERFAIIALTAGQTVVWFTQRRVFQPDRPPRAELEIRVHVR